MGLGNKNMMNPMMGLFHPYMMDPMFVGMQFPLGGIFMKLILLILKIYLKWE